MVPDSENYYIRQATAIEDWATDKPHYLNDTKQPRKHETVPGRDKVQHLFYPQNCPAFYTWSSLSYHARASIHSSCFSFINRAVLVRTTSLSVVSAFSKQDRKKIAYFKESKQENWLFQVVTTPDLHCEEFLISAFMAMLNAMTYTIPVLLEEILFICHKNQYPHREDEEN